MDFLLDPNVGYLLLVGGSLLTVLALFVPGSGYLEVGAAFALLLAGYALINLPVNVWAIALAVLGLVPLFLTLRGLGGRRFWALVLLGIAMLIVGSIYAFRGEDGGPAIDPLLAVITSGSTGLFLWFIARKGLEAVRKTPSHQLDLMGKTGVVRKDIRQEGSVYIEGEEWTASSPHYIPAGAKVRVIARNGLRLEVEKSETEES